ncbi:MAG: hypothetical protein PUK59_05355 [Actinomycetaceae bacterium]|nr:hypothetical protein [Actinomycetaceae bacterium]MDY5854214.1 hypothetical protein [Arcanobacterium sp.]
MRVLRISTGAAVAQARQDRDAQQTAAGNIKRVSDGTDTGQYQRRDGTTPYKR